MRTPPPAVRETLEAFVRVSSYANVPESFSAERAVAQLQKAQGGVLYVDGGWQTLVDGLAERARASGARVTSGARVEAIEPGAAGGLRVRVAGGRTLEPRAVVLATPAREAGELLASAGARVPESLRASVPIRMATLDLALARLPRAEPRFVLGIDRPLYLSVHSGVAKVAPDGAALIHASKYLRGDEPDADADRAELESLVELAQPGFRDHVVHAQWLPRITVAERLDVASEAGALGRPSPIVTELPGVFLAGDWVQGGSWLADGSLGSARTTAEEVLARLEPRKAVA